MMDYRKPGTVEVVYPIAEGTPDHTHPFATGAVRPGPQLTITIFSSGQWMAEVQYAKVRKDGSTSVTVGEVRFSGQTEIFGDTPQYVADAVERARVVQRFAFPDGNAS